MNEQQILQGQSPIPPVPPTVDLTGGLVNGAEVHDISGRPTGERIVHELDANGTVIGWHKETIQSEGQI